MAEQLAGIFTDLGLNQSIIIQAVIFIVFYQISKRVFFRPFLDLISERNRRTREDREAAEKLLAQAEAKVAEYEKRIRIARNEARGAYENIVAEARNEETAILNRARHEVKEITQEALGQITKQREDLRRTLLSEAEKIAEEVTQKLLVKS